MIVRVDENAEAWAGAEMKVSQEGSRVRPKSVEPRIK